MWGTILFEHDPQAKVERRRSILLGALREAGHAMELEEMRSGFRAAQRVINEQIVRDQRDIGPAGRWSELMRQLRIAPDRLPFSAVNSAYEDLTLEFLPPLMDGVGTTVARLAERYRLGLICNTGYTGGWVLRRVLERHGLDRYFQVLTFSNEYGFLKPHAGIFRHTLQALGAEAEESLHVGDAEDYDVAGALGAGLYAARYLPGMELHGGVQSAADLIFFEWSEFEDLVEDKQRRPA